MEAQKISHLYRFAGDTGRPLFSCEFFPPKKVEDVEKFYNTVEKLNEQKPGFVSVTYGAGGSNQDHSLECTVEIQNRYQLVTMAHYTTIGSGQQDVFNYISRLWRAGVRNIMALRGDIPQNNPNYAPATDSFHYSNELIHFIKSSGFDFCLGGACYPEVHPQARSAQQDLENLKKKVDAGAEFLITQLFFLNDAFFSFRDACQRLGIEVPIIPGIMPITNFNQIERFTRMAACCFPKELLSCIERCGNDRNSLLKVSLDFSMSQCRELLDQNVPGLHFYTLNQSHITGEILKAL